MITRREFLKLGAMAGASLVLPTRWLSRPLPAYAFSQSDPIKKFIEPLRKVGSGIPLASPDTVKQDWWQPGVTHYTIDIGQFEDQLHPDLQNPTRLWGYGQGGNFKHLGGVIAAKRGEPVQITFRNQLPPTHILPVDTTIMGAEGAQNRTSSHLHGGLVPWISDGGPHAWWDPSGGKGESFLNNQVLRPGQNVPNDEAEYYYPNNQGARLVWYHDHALGITRLNAYAGIASGYVITDDYELALAARHNLPGALDSRTVYLIFQDKSFVPTDFDDPTWNVPGTQPGHLWYAHEYDPGDLEDPLPPDALPLPTTSEVPEFFGDTILVNGTVYPYLEVEPRQYRFRLLNACNARFLNPHLMYAKGSDFPNSTEPSSKKAGPAFIQIGNECGFIPHPVMFNGVRQGRLLLAPAERADLIVDFRDVPAGSNLLLCTEAAAPFPDGDPVIETTPGYGPNTRTLLQIRVVKRKGSPNPSITLPGKFAPTDPYTLTQKPRVPTAIPEGVPVRHLTLNEVFDEFGRLIQFLGPDSQGDLGFGREYMDDPTEVIPHGTSEVWEILNMTGDTHPIHFHLVNVQVLSRQPFDADTYAGGTPTYTGAAYAPDDNELGWKETVRMNPGEVTRVFMTFNLPDVPFTVPETPRLDSTGQKLGGAEYVWHCHILEHEEHDMMRPLIVK